VTRWTGQERSTESASAHGVSAAMGARLQPSSGPAGASPTAGTDLFFAALGVRLMASGL
jgi:hypothetical protein